jgi:hypothetical protein
MSVFQYKQSGRVGLYDKNESSEKLSKLGNPLEKLHKIIDFEMFRSVVEENFWVYLVVTAFQILAQFGYFKRI